MIISLITANALQKLIVYLGTYFAWFKLLAIEKGKKLVSKILLINFIMLSTNRMPEWV
jgi:hypothetical protein